MSTAGISYFKLKPQKNSKLKVLGVSPRKRIVRGKLRRSVVMQIRINGKNRKIERRYGCARSKAEAIQICQQARMALISTLAIEWLKERKIKCLVQVVRHGKMHAYF